MILYDTIIDNWIILTYFIKSTYKMKFILIIYYKILLSLINLISLKFKKKYKIFVHIKEIKVTLPNNI